LTQFFLDMAFDAEAFSDPKSVKAYLRNWAGLNFGREQQNAVADIMWRYYKLAFDRNPEFMTWATLWPETSARQTKFNMLDFGDENARRADAYRAISGEADNVMAALPADRKAAFYQLVQYQVVTGTAMNLVPLDIDKAITYGMQRRASANVYAARAKAADQTISAAVRRYNRLENGRWKGIVSEDFLRPPPNFPTWQGTGPDKSCALQVEGGGYYAGFGWWTPTLPTFHRELGNHSYYLDLFVHQPTDGDWSVTAKDPWIKVDRTSGRFSAAGSVSEQRINVSVDWSKAPKEGDGLLTVKCGAGQPADVHVRVVPPVMDKGVSFIEAQGVVSIYAEHADAKSGAWHVLDGVGHTGADLQADLDLPPVDAADPAQLAKAPRVDYAFATEPLDRDYSFANYVLDNIVTFRAIGLPVFPTTKDGKLRIGVSIDGAPMKVLDFSNEYYAATWRENVMNNTAVAEIRDIPFKPGKHTLTVYALDPGVTLDRFEIAFKGASSAYGPIPETRIVDRK